MADSNATVALNIGSQRISMAVFETSKNGSLILKSYDSESIAADPSMDAARISQTRTAVANLAQRLKVSKSKARYAISGQSVITKFVKLPPLVDDNIEQLVTFEAQQQIPFPISEVVWDYELIESSGEKEVMIVAIKADALDEINEAVNDSGLGTAEVDVSPMAIYNAFRASYGEPAETVLLIDIGAKTSNLIYVEGKRFFTRSVNVGGAAVTSAIAKEFGVSFAEAESQKVTNGLVALGGGHTDQLDPNVAALATSIRNALTRLPSEISRTTNFYRSQQGGSAPQRVLIAGGGASLPYTLEFLQEKLSLPVEFFNPLQAVSMGKGVNAEALKGEAHQMGELVGLGLRGVGKSTISIDLVPAVLEQARAADKRKPFLIGAAALLLLGAGAWAGLQFAAASAAEAKASEMKETEESLAPYDSSIGGLLRKEQSLRDIATSYTNAERDHSYWYQLLAEVETAFASEAVWVTDFEPLAGFVPIPEDPRPVNGRPVVKPDFANVPYGVSALAEIPVEAPTGRGSRRSRQAPEAPTINAVRIKGFWLENPASQAVVSNLLGRLRAEPEKFTFQTQYGKETVELKDEEILGVTVTGQGGEFGLPFELSLPLSRNIPIK